jgi:hypothetical protein
MGRQGALRTLRFASIGSAISRSARLTPATVVAIGACLVSGCASLLEERATNKAIAAAAADDSFPSATEAGAIAASAPPATAAK